MHTTIRSERCMSDSRKNMDEPVMEEEKSVQIGGVEYILTRASRVERFLEESFPGNPNACDLAFSLCEPKSHRDSCMYSRDISARTWRDRPLELSIYTLFDYVEVTYSFMVALVEFFKTRDIVFADAKKHSQYSAYRGNTEQFVVKYRIYSSLRLFKSLPYEAVKVTRKENQ